MEKQIGKLLGSGGTSDVYEWSDSEVIKIYKSHVSDGTINHEEYIGKLLNNTFLNIPKLIDSISIDGKRALIYERKAGNILAAPMLKGIYEKELAQKFAKMHYDIHMETISELPLQYEFFYNRITGLSNILGDKSDTLLKLLNSIPTDTRLCHGDYQPLNILGEADSYTVIDWNGACSGNPVLDVAWTYLTLNSPVVKHLLGEETSKIITLFIEEYLTHYCQLSGMESTQVLKCLPLVAVRRLYDNNSSDTDVSKLERDWLYQILSEF